MTRAGFRSAILVFEWLLRTSRHTAKYYVYVIKIHFFFFKLHIKSQKMGCLMDLELLLPFQGFIISAYHRNVILENHSM